VWLTLMIIPLSYCAVAKFEPPDDFLSQLESQVYLSSLSATRVTTLWTLTNTCPVTRSAIFCFSTLLQQKVARKYAYHLHHTQS